MNTNPVEKKKVKISSLKMSNSILNEVRSVLYTFDDDELIRVLKRSKFIA